MKDLAAFDRRPIVVALAGPNGAGKSTFYHAHLRAAGLRFVNADVLTLEFGLDAYAGARMADAIRRELLRRKESFVFETVFSDPVGEKVRFLQEAAAAGFHVVLCFIGLARPALSEERVAMRVSQGGHDVPGGKLKDRYPRTLANLARALRVLPQVLIYDNSDLRRPYRELAVYERGRCVHRVGRLPAWVAKLLRTPGRPT